MDDAASAPALTASVVRDVILHHMDARAIGALASTSKEMESITRAERRFARLLETRFGSFGDAASGDSRTTRGMYVTVVSAIERLRDRLGKEGCVEAMRAATRAAHACEEFADARAAPDGYEYVDAEYEDVKWADAYEFENYEAYGARGDPGVRELAQTLASKYFNAEEYETAVMALMTFREILVKTRGFGCFSDPPKEADLVRSGMRFVLRAVPNEYGRAMLAPDGLFHRVLPNTWEEHCRAARETSSQARARFTLEEHAEWACDAHGGAHEICHVYAPLSVLLFTEPKAKLFPPCGVIGFGPYPHGGRPRADLQRKVLAGGEPTNVRAMDGTYSGFRYPCDIESVGFGFMSRETLRLDEDDVVRFRLQINIPTGYAVGDMTKDVAGPRANGQRQGCFKHVSRDERRISAFLEDGLGKMKMEGIVYETEHGFPRLVLRGRYDGNFYPGALVTFYGSISPTCVSGFCLRDDGALGVSDVFTFWPV